MFRVEWVILKITSSGRSSISQPTKAKPIQADTVRVQIQTGKVPIFGDGAFGAILGHRGGNEFLRPSSDLISLTHCPQI